MPIVRIVGSKDDFRPPSKRGKQTARGMRHYRVRCEGLTKEECQALTKELGRHFEIVPKAARNPALPSAWDGVYNISLFLAPILLPKLIDILNDIRKDRVAKGKEPITGVIYGPDGKPVRRFKKPPASEKS